MKKGVPKRRKKKSSGYAKRPQKTTRPLNRGSRIRAFMVTLNNPTGDDRERFTDWCDPEARTPGEVGNIRYGVGQLEIASTGTPRS